MINADTTNCNSNERVDDSYILLYSKAYQAFDEVIFQTITYIRVIERGPLPPSVRRFRPGRFETGKSCRRHCTSRQSGSENPHRQRDSSGQLETVLSGTIDMVPLH